MKNAVRNVVRVVLTLSAAQVDALQHLIDSASSKTVRVHHSMESLADAMLTFGIREQQRREDVYASRSSSREATELQRKLDEARNALLQTMLTPEQRRKLDAATRKSDAFKAANALLAKSGVAKQPDAKPKASRKPRAKKATALSSASHTVAVPPTATN